MNNFMSSSHTLNNSSRKIPFRPYSASRRKLKINSSLETPPPIIFTMPNNPKKLSGMGNNIEREQLYENNMQLKDIINKLKRELAETRNQLVKKDLEVKKKERIIKECSKENDIEFVHELNLEKARESTLVSLCKDKYKKQAYYLPSTSPANQKFWNLESKSSPILRIKVGSCSAYIIYTSVFIHNKHMSIRSRSYYSSIGIGR